MKKFFIFCSVLPLFFASISTVYGQHDLLTVKPDNTHGDQCGFVMTITNHNAQAKNIDEVVLDITSTNGNPVFIDVPVISHWTPNFTDSHADMTSDNGGISPNTSFTGLVFAYTIDADKIEPPISVSINWTTKSSGEALDSGTISPICTAFQSFTELDTATAIPSQSGGDPCFTFTMRNRNQPNGFSIYNVSFQLENTNGGSMRPSKITPATGWVLDSASLYTAYYHTDNNPILPNTSVGGWEVCLRANPAVNKFNMVWSAFDAGNSFIDRDTIFNISNTATSSATESDSLSVKAAVGCLYNITLKNLHLTNLLPPSRVVKLILRSKTSGIAFAAAPTYPLHWKKPQITNDSIVYVSDSLFDGIPDGVVSTNQFSFSVNGPTTSNFDIGWETYRARVGVDSAFPPQTTLVSSGTVTTKCTVAAPATDAASNTAGQNECDYKLTVTNAHNIPSQSNLTSLKISIPANSGQLAASAGPAGWVWSNPGTQITYSSPSSSDNIVSGNSQDFLYSFAPKTPGSNVTATWTTTDDQGTATGTGTFQINCTPISNVCDTFVQTGILSNDSCAKIFTLTNKRTTTVTQLVVSLTNGWQIDTASTPTGWVKQIVGKSQVNYNSTNGLKAGDNLIFNMKFIRYYPDTLKPPPDAFAVIAVTTDANNVNCTSTDTVTPGCLAIPIHVTNAVPTKYTEDIGVANFRIVPNPTHGSADISFDLGTTEKVVLSVIDVLGNQITTLNNKLMTQGSYHIPYTMSGLPDGTYYVRMQTPLGVMTRKLILTK
ncbi:MAG: T9SS type A sorting domain-containing protein [Candidatus Kapaibacterium sp.]